MAMTYHSESSVLKHPVEVDRALRYAKEKMHDAIWDEDEETQKALQRQIDRLEILKSVGERYDVDH